MNINADLQSTLRRVLNVLAALGLKYHCTGGLVASFYGEPRFTQDIDIVISLSGQEPVIPPLIERLSSEFLIDRDLVQRAIQRSDMFQALDTENFIKIDFHVGEAIPGELDRSSIQELFPGLPIPIVAKEDAILSKLLWIKKGSGKSRQDVIMMLRGQGEINWVELNRFATQLGVEWKGTPAEFAALLMEAADQVRRANPQAKVILAGMARGPSDIFVDLMTTQNIGEYFDIFALHAYAESWLTERLEDVFPKWPETMAGLIVRHAPGRPLWLNEYGYPDWRFKPNRASMWSDSPDVFYDYEHTPRYQAIELVKTMILALASRQVTLMTWYRIRDYADIADVGGQDAVNQHLGLVDAQGKPKPAYDAFKFATELFSQPLRGIDDSLKIDAPASSQARVHAIERRDGSVIIAGWLRASHAGEVKDHSGTLKDPRREEVKITLPNKNLDPVHLKSYDAQGRRVAVNTPYDPASNTLTLTLTGSDLLLLITPPAD